MVDIGKIQVNDLKFIFDDEKHFSKYLSENLDIINSKIPGYEVSNIDTDVEVPVGTFRCDVSGGIVSIENQLGPSDHDHLGKLLVYFSNQDVKVGIWICEKARPEHIKSVQWLNEHCDADDEAFFLLEAKIIRIEDSKPAVDFDLIVSPEFKEIGRKRREISGQNRPWEDFFTSIKKQYHQAQPDAKINKAGRVFMKLRTGITDVHFEWLVSGRKGERKIEVSLHFEDKNKETNMVYLNSLEVHLDELEDLLEEKIWFGEYAKNWAYISISKTFVEPISDDVLEWSVSKMKILYDFLQPKLLAL